jgi:hypothetical protein
MPADEAHRRDVDATREVVQDVYVGDVGDDHRAAVLLADLNLQVERRDQRSRDVVEGRVPRLGGAVTPRTRWAASMPRTRTPPSRWLAMAATRSAIVRRRGSLGPSAVGIGERRMGVPPKTACKPSRRVDMSCSGHGMSQSCMANGTCQQE